MSDRTFEHMGNTRKITFPELSDEEMAGKVRMLTTGDWQDHEFVVCGARDRILALAKEKHELMVVNTELLEALRELADYSIDRSFSDRSKLARSKACKLLKQLEEKEICDA